MERLPVRPANVFDIVPSISRIRECRTYGVEQALAPWPARAQACRLKPASFAGLRNALQSKSPIRTHCYSYSPQSTFLALGAISGATRSPWISPVTSSATRTIAPSAQHAMKMKNPLLDGGKSLWRLGDFDCFIIHFFLLRCLASVRRGFLLCWLVT